MGSELLSKLSELDSQAGNLIEKARKEAESIGSTLSDEVDKIEKAAEQKLEAETAKHSSELSARREKELATIEAERKAQLEVISAVPDSKIAEGADLVARLLTEE